MMSSATPTTIRIEVPPSPRDVACETTWAEASGLSEKIDHPYVRAMAAAYGAAFAHDLLAHQLVNMALQCDHVLRQFFDPVKGQDADF